MTSSKSFEKPEQALCQLCQVGKSMDRLDKKSPYRKALTYLTWKEKHDCVKYAGEIVSDC